MALPALLAGPILRRTDAGRVAIWAATTDGVDVAAEVVRFGAGSAIEPLARASGRTTRLGRALAVHIVTVEAPDPGFPTDELLGYDIELSDGSERRRLGDLGLLHGTARLTYSGLPLPTFYIRKATPALHVIHGSCRMLHGHGEDAMLAADEVLEHSARDIAARPSGLFLTGDQIYADDVAAPMIGHIRRLATELMGGGDAASVPGVGSLEDVPVNGRRGAIKNAAGFTSGHAHNHLMSFGEFAAMYLTAWNDSVWPATWPPAARALPASSRLDVVAAAARRRYERARKDLERARAALPAVRRVLANTPTFMCFDDHDTTDDWNLTRAWRDRVWSSSTGRRIVANALAAFWAFQGWGNDPDAYTEMFRNTVSDHLTGAADDDGNAYEETLWSFDGWSYITPTSPPAIVLDTRTQRDYDSADGGARLLGKEARRRVVELTRRAGYERGEPLVVVSPVPVFGFELQERRQKYLVDKLGPYEIDFEAWHSNLHGLVDLMELIEEIDPSWCVLLSGDVHYGVNARASFSIDGKRLLFIQLVSSGQKHAGAAAKKTLNSLGRVLHRKHERLGWVRPPETRKHKNVAKRFLSRAVNTDEWDQDSPVFLAPRHVEMLGIEQAPDFHECRIYVRPEGVNSSMLVGENNVGFMSLGTDHVTHRLLARGKRGTHTHTARMTLAAGDLPSGWRR